MRDVTILNRDGLALIERLEDAPGMAVYCDPPYVKKNSRYIHDFDAGEHRELATMLGRFKTARVVVSYYDHPLVRELYAGWTIRLTPMTKAMVQGNSRTKGVTIAPEILIFNGPSFAETEAVDRGIFSLATGEKPVTSK
jgi:DNA adenine methylase